MERLSPNLVNELLELQWVVASRPFQMRYSELVFSNGQNAFLLEVRRARAQVVVYNLRQVCVVVV